MFIGLLFGGLYTDILRRYGLAGR